MLRVTADTNIYVSAFAIGGKPLSFLQLANSGQINLAISEAILDEIARVLSRPKFGWSKIRIVELQQLLSNWATLVKPTQTLDIVSVDPTDNRILECAVEAGSQVIVSGDKHLLQMHHYNGIPILKVSDFLLRTAQFVL